MNDDKLNSIYDRTSGYCHICHKKLSFKNYGMFGEKGAWEVEHSVPKAKGGTNRMNNLYPACISCNRSKGDSHTKTVRSYYGQTRAPYSKKKIAEKKNTNTLGGAAAGAAVGVFFGPEGALIGAVIGGIIGNRYSPKK
jgi:5-methylcytosine-specific restriction endonuclease McrA